MALAAPALAQTQNPEIRWRLASSFPKNLDILYGGSEYLAKRVAQMTDNRFQLRVFGAGEIVPALQVLDGLQSGTVECGQTASLYYVGKDPTFAAFTAIPFGMNMRQMTAWLRHGGGNEIAAELYRDYNVVGIPFGDTGTQMGGWFRKEIRSLEDLSGLKFRISGFAGHLFAKLGAAPTQIAGPDIYPSLERGTIDAAEWIGPYDDEKLGFARIAKYYYAPGFWEGSSRGVFMVNQRAWDSLPDTYRHILEVACGEATMEMMARYDEGNPKALRRLVAGGAQLRGWPQGNPERGLEGLRRAVRGDGGAEPAVPEDVDELQGVPGRPVPVVPGGGECVREFPRSSRRRGAEGGAVSGGGTSPAQCN